MNPAPPKMLPDYTHWSFEQKVAYYTERFDKLREDEPHKSYNRRRSYQAAAPTHIHSLDKAWGQAGLGASILEIFSGAYYYHVTVQPNMLRCKQSMDRSVPGTDFHPLLSADEMLQLMNRGTPAQALALRNFALIYAARDFECAYTCYTLRTAGYENIAHANCPAGLGEDALHVNDPSNVQTLFSSTVPVLTEIASLAAYDPQATWHQNFIKAQEALRRDGLDKPFAF